MLLKIISKLSKTEQTISFVPSNCRTNNKTCKKYLRMSSKQLLLSNPARNGPSFCPESFEMADLSHCILDSENLLHLCLGIFMSTRL